MPMRGRRVFSSIGVFVRLVVCLDLWKCGNELGRAGIVGVVIDVHIHDTPNCNPSLLCGFQCIQNSRLITHAVVYGKINAVFCAVNDTNCCLHTALPAIFGVLNCEIVHDQVNGGYPRRIESNTTRIVRDRRIGKTMPSMNDGAITPLRTILFHKQPDFVNIEWLLHDIIGYRINKGAGFRCEYATGHKYNYILQLWKCLGDCVVEVNSRLLGASSCRKRYVRRLLMQCGSAFKHYSLLRNEWFKHSAQRFGDHRFVINNQYS